METPFESADPWLNAPSAPTYAALDEDLSVDVVVIGGGMAGLTAAFLLKQAGRRVAVLGARRCGSGGPAESIGYLSALPDASLSALVDRVGPEPARLVWEAGFAAVSKVRAIVRDERINCQFAWVPEYVFASPRVPVDRARRAMGVEARVAEALGLPARYVDRVPGIGSPGVMFDHQARLHPLRYLEVLAARVHGDGSYVFEDSVVTAVHADRDVVQVGRHQVRARYIVAAANRMDQIGARRTLVERSGHGVRAILPPGDLAEGLYSEHAEGARVHWRVDRADGFDECLLVGISREQDETDPARLAVRQLSAALHREIDRSVVTHVWTSASVGSPDGLPHIGEVAPRRFVASGLGTNSLTFGTLAGMMAADAALCRHSTWRRVFDPARPPVSAASPRPWRRPSERQPVSDAVYGVLLP